MNFDTDKIAGLLVQLSIRMARKRPFATWKPGEKLKILLVGYNGKQNTGSDTRVEAMVNQFYHILGHDNVEIGVIIFDEKSVDSYFPPPMKQERISSIFFLPLLKTCGKYHMAVLSEGCCLKSKFANSLLLYFLEGAGVMREQGKPCIAYGVEAGYMDPFIKRMTRKICTQVDFIARTQPSLNIIQDMNLKGELGTDTAWIFNPASPQWAADELQAQLGWNGTQPLVGVSVINPYCWPVKPDFRRFLTLNWRKNPLGHYKRWYFFSDSAKRRRQYALYLESISRAVNDFAKRHNAVVAILGMEALDLDPCQRLNRMLSVPSHVFSSRFYNGYQMTALLRRLSFLITSRYHARVLSMPGGVPSIGVSMDERIYNLMLEANHIKDYYLETDDPQLESKLQVAIDKLWRHREQLRREVLNTMPGYLRSLAEMGVRFRGYIKSSFPQFQLPPEPADWTGYLPALPPELQEVISSPETCN